MEINPVNPCEHLDKVGAYHDNELNEADRLAMAEHLKRCTECSSELQSIQAISTAAKRLVIPELSAQALSRIHKAVDAAPANSIRRMAMELTAVAASILLGCGVWLWLSGAGFESVNTAMPIWEASAVQRPNETAAGSTEDQMAMWIVDDLSQGDSQ